MAELWLKGNSLVSEKEWEEIIESLKSGRIIRDKEKAKKELRRVLVRAIERRLPEKRFGILFSGGVDSSLIAAISRKAGKRFICYSVGFQEEKMKEPEDITEAKKVASKLGFELRYKIYGLREVGKIVEKVVKILRPAGKDDVVNVGVGAVELAAMELAKEDKISYFLGGLGSEEIFAGYERHKVKDVNQECWRGLKGMWSRDLVRDFTLGKEMKAVLRTPFLDRELIELAMEIPGKWKIDKDRKKIILREVAEEFLGEFAWRKKKAAQYGSGFDKAVSKLAKKEGFRLKKDYLEKI
jgi:asparagine synthase (glutamine-hydrolysing)